MTRTKDEKRIDELKAKIAKMQGEHKLVVDGLKQKLKNAQDDFTSLKKDMKKRDAYVRKLESYSAKLVKQAEQQLTNATAFAKFVEDNKEEKETKKEKKTKSKSKSKKSAKKSKDDEDDKSDDEDKDESEAEDDEGEDDGAEEDDGSDSDDSDDEDENDFNKTLFRKSKDSNVKLADAFEKYNECYKDDEDKMGSKKFYAFIKENYAVKKMKGSQHVLGVSLRA